jgi:LmbE family N-acetylglucosaminyl deacetylase
MKKLLFGIFAHPDDEAFGPSAYLYRQAHTGVDVHLIVVTDGDAGRNEGYDDLASQRVKEWLESGKRIGVKSNKALHFPDGGLCNNLYLKIADEIIEHIEGVLKTYRGMVEVDFLTFENRGISGHLDHIATSFITTYVFERMKQSAKEKVRIHQLLYYCLTKTRVPQSNISWIYMPAGYDDEETGLSHPYSDIADKKFHIMHAHESQKTDMQYVIESHKNDKGELEDEYVTDNFIIHQ